MKKYNCIDYEKIVISNILLKMKLNAKIHKRIFVYYIKIMYFRIFCSCCSSASSVSSCSFRSLTIQMSFQFFLLTDKLDVLFYHYEVSLFDL